jgi:hypothetical protein
MWTRWFEMSVQGRGALLIRGVTRWQGVFKSSAVFVNSTFVLWQAWLSPSYNWYFADPMASPTQQPGRHGGHLMN